MGRELRFTGRLVPDDWTCDRETPHPQRGPSGIYWESIGGYRERLLKLLTR